MRPVAALALSVFLAVAAAGVTGLAAAEDAKEETTVKEPGSGIELPIEITVLGDAKQLLTGVALREKTIFKVDVYVAGHYVDAAGAREALAAWKDKTQEDLAKDAELRKKLLAPGFARTLRLRLARDIDSEDFNSAFEDSLSPRMEKLLESGEKGKELDVTTLKGLFTVDELEEKTNIDFTWKDGVLTVAMDGKKLGTIESPALCHALWDVYFGDDPIQSEFPRKLVGRLATVLAP